MDNLQNPSAGMKLLIVIRLEERFALTRGLEFRFLDCGSVRLTDVSAVPAVLTKLVVEEKNNGHVLCQSLQILIPLLLKSFYGGLF